MKDILGREVVVGDLVIAQRSSARMYELTKHDIAIVISDERAFNLNGEFKYGNCYKIENLSEADKKIKTELEKVYLAKTTAAQKKKVADAEARKALRKKGALNPGDILYDKEGHDFYIYLGRRAYKCSCTERKSAYIYAHLFDGLYKEEVLKKAKNFLLSLDTKKMKLSEILEAVDTFYNTQLRTNKSVNYTESVAYADKMLQKGYQLSNEDGKPTIDMSKVDCKIFYVSFYKSFIRALSNPDIKLTNKLGHIDIIDNDKEQQILLVNVYRDYYDKSIKNMSVQRVILNEMKK